MGLNIKTKINSSSKIIKDHGLDDGGGVQRFLRDEADRLMNPYVPTTGGDGSPHLRGNKTYPNNKTIKYTSPYAHYQYYGKLMLAKSGSSWAKKGETKHYVGKSLTYHYPGTGPKWDKMMLQRRGKELEKDVQNYIKKRRIIMKKSKIELIRDFLETCPYLNNGKINVDYIKDKPQSYAINETPANPIVAKFTDGGSRRQIVFDFSVQANFSILENIKNSKFCDDFTEWIEKQNDLDDLPKIENAESIECTGRGTILQTTETTAIYVIPMRVVYLKEI